MRRRPPVHLGVREEVCAGGGDNSVFSARNVPPSPQLRTRVEPENGRGKGGGGAGGGSVQRVCKGEGQTGRCLGKGGRQEGRVACRRQTVENGKNNVQHSLRHSQPLPTASPCPTAPCPLHCHTCRHKATKRRMAGTIPPHSHTAVERGGKGAVLVIQTAVAACRLTQCLSGVAGERLWLLWWEVVGW